MADFAPMGEIFGGRYELVDALGRGGSGDVWRVWDHRGHRYLAGKVLHQADSASLLRFVRETGRRFDHPHIVAPLGWVGEDDRVMFAMPLVHGGTISTLLREQGPLPPSYVAAVADQMLDALTVIHATGLVHRDVKPANILMEPTPSGAPDARLADFGISARIGDPRMTRVTDQVGTPGFMSPQARVGADPEPSQDIYSLGVTMIQLLSGTPPVGDTPPPLPDRLRDTPLGRFIAACLTGTPHRPATAIQAREMLAPLLGETPFAPVQVPDRTPPLPPQWGFSGPRPEFLAPGPAISGSGGVTPSSASGQVEQVQQSDQAGRVPARRHSVSSGDVVLAIAIAASVVLVVVLILMLG